MFSLANQTLNGFAKLDVSFAHGNSSGAIDNDHLFYLASAVPQLIQPGALNTHADAVENFRGHFGSVPRFSSYDDQRASALQRFSEQRNVFRRANARRGRGRI